jgi:NAD+ synthase
VNVDALKLKSDLVAWLRGQLTATKSAGYVVGVSGGIDSAVASLLANDACKAEGKTFTPLCLPISVHGGQDGRDMRSFFTGYSIEALLFDLTAIFDAFMKFVPDIDDPFTLVTIKHRLRMDFVYTYAKRHNLLVISTVNKIEFSTGYFPKLAGLGDVMPLADLRKEQIRDIAAVYDVPAELAQRKASGCIYGRTAEEEWGFTEDDGDQMTLHLDNLELTPGLHADKIKAFAKMRNNTHHKRGFPPMFRLKQNSAG